MRWQGIVFDLDGTLVDSLPDIVSSLNHGLAELGLPPRTPEWVRRHLGHGARHLVEAAAGAAAASALEVRFVNRYAAHPCRETLPYPGVDDLLDRLGQTGVPLAILTNKTARVAEQVVTGLGWAGRFRQVWGGDSFPERKPSPVGLWRFAELHGLERSRVLMVGDSSVDVACARAAGAASCFIAGGYGALGPDDPRPDMALEQFADLADWVD